MSRCITLVGNAIRLQSESPFNFHPRYLIHSRRLTLRLFLCARASLSRIHPPGPCHCSYPPRTTRRNYYIDTNRQWLAFTGRFNPIIILPLLEDLSSAPDLFMKHCCLNVPLLLIHSKYAKASSSHPNFPNRLVQSPVTKKANDRRHHSSTSNQLILGMRFVARGRTDRQSTQFPHTKHKTFCDNTEDTVQLETEALLSQSHSCFWSYRRPPCQQFIKTKIKDLIVKSVPPFNFPSPLKTHQQKQLKRNFASITTHYTCQSTGHTQKPTQHRPLPPPFGPSITSHTASSYHPSSYPTRHILPTLHRNIPFTISYVTHSLSLPRTRPHVIFREQPPTGNPQVLYLFFVFLTATAFSS